MATFEEVAAQLKELGNECFRKKQYQSAIDYYSQAITRDPKTVAYYTNRATAYYKLHESNNPEKSRKFKEWLNEPTLPTENEKNKFVGDKTLLLAAIGDCKRACYLDEDSMKGHFYHGVVLLILGDLIESQKHFLLAYDLALSTGMSATGTISDYLLKIRAKLSYSKEVQRLRKYVPLYQKILRLVENDYNVKCENIARKHGLAESPDYPSFRRNKLFQDDIEKAARSYHRTLNDLKQTFKPIFVSSSKDKQIRQNYIRSANLEAETNANTELSESPKMDVTREEIPDHLLDPISFNIFQDPVVVPSGQSFERAWLEKYVKKNGQDPFTKEPLTLQQIFPNHGLRKAVVEFTKNHVQI